MKIHTNSGNRLIALLDRPDMERYGIAFETLDLRQQQTEKLIYDLLKLSGISLKGRRCRLNIDAVADGEDKMYIILTLTNCPARRSTRLRIEGRRFFCVLFSGESLFPLCDALKPYNSVIGECRLYTDGGSYAVELSQNALDKINLKHILSEFGSVRPCPSRLARARLNEHYRLICDDFIRRLSP